MLLDRTIVFKHSYIFSGIDQQPGPGVQRLHHRISFQISGYEFETDSISRDSFLEKWIARKNFRINLVLSIRHIRHIRRKDALRFFKSAFTSLIWHPLQLYKTSLKLDVCDCQPKN